ncbi:Rep family protein [Weissella viridescens]|uniref:Rep family protein n=1 Tax=Weissella viridescens TaxID=1629 RepID=UPI003AF1E610
MGANHKRIRTVTYVQQVKYLKLPIEKIDQRLNALADNHKDFEFAYIKHDQDTNDDGTVEPHYHIIMRTSKGSGFTLKRWAEIFDDDENRIKFFKGYFNTGIAYMLHRTPGASEKHQYETSDITANFDVSEALDAGKKETNQAGSNKVKNALNQLDLGVKSYNDLADSLIGDEKVNFLRKAKDIITYKQTQPKEIIPLSVTYIYGVPGSGKSRLARYLAGGDDGDIRKYYVSASNRDPFGKYNGQTKVILDDLRDTFDVDELLRMLDTYNPNRVASSRYYDKDLRDVTDIYITTLSAPKVFFRRNYPKEDDKQFLRRLDETIHINDNGTTYTSTNRNDETVTKPLPWFEALEEHA